MPSPAWRWFARLPWGLAATAGSVLFEDRPAQSKRRSGQAHAPAVAERQARIGMAGPAGVRSRAFVWLGWNDSGHVDAVAVASRVEGSETGHDLAGAVSVGRNGSHVSGQGPACGKDHSADAACGGAGLRDCSAAETEQSVRWCSGPRPKRGDSKRDAGALLQSASAMKGLRESPKRRMGKSIVSGNSSAFAGVMPQSREMAHGRRAWPAACGGVGRSEIARVWLDWAGVAWAGAFSPVAAPARMLALR